MDPDKKTATGDQLQYEELAVFDSESFARSERDFQSVLAELVGDKSLEKFRLEYERLHRALKKSHESEKRLIKRCRELHSEIVTNAAKVATALKLSQEDQKTISQLRKELEKAWKMVDMHHQKDRQSKDTIQKLRVEIGGLNRLVEQGAGLSIGQEHSVKELLKIKEDLTREREDLADQVESVKAEIVSLMDKLAAQEKQKVQAELEVKRIKGLLAAKSVDTEKEQLRRRNLEAQVKDLRMQLEQKVGEIKAREQAVARSQSVLSSLEHQLAEQRSMAERVMKEKDLLNDKIHKAEQDLLEQMDHNTQLVAENSQRQVELKVREEQTKEMEANEQRLLRAKKNLQDRTRSLELQLSHVEEEREKYRGEQASYEKEIDSLKRRVEEHRRQYEEMQRDRDLLNKKLVKATSDRSKQQALVLTSDLSKRNLQQEIESYKQENQRQRKEIYQLEKERQKYTNDTQGASATYLQAMEEVKLREMSIAELQKQIVEQDGKLKQQKAMYEAVRSERNVHSKNLIEAQDAITEMKRKFKIMNHQIDQLKEDIAARRAAQVSEKFQHLKVLKVRDKYKFELDHLQKQLSLAEETIGSQQEEIQRVTQLVTDADAENNRQKKEFEIVVNERDFLVQQLVRRNDELALLHEKVSIQKSCLAQGENQYRERVEDTRVLKAKLADMQREMNILRSSMTHTDNLKAEVCTLQKELLGEKTKVKALSEELEKPMNIHRWRKLESRDPNSFELVQKIQTLQKRLIQKTEQVVERDVVIQDKQQRLQQMEQQLSRLPDSKEAAQQLSQCKLAIKDRNSQLKALTSELNMYQVQTNEYRSEIERMTDEMNALKKTYYESKRREQMRREKERESRDSEAKSQAGPFQPTLGAAPRYMGGGFGLFKSPQHVRGGDSAGAEAVGRFEADRIAKTPPVKVATVGEDLGMKDRAERDVGTGGGETDVKSLAALRAGLEEVMQLGGRATGEDVGDDMPSDARPALHEELKALERSALQKMPADSTPTSAALDEEVDVFAVVSRVAELESELQEDLTVVPEVVHSPVSTTASEDLPIGAVDLNDTSSPSSAVPTSDVRAWSSPRVNDDELDPPMITTDDVAETLTTLLADADGTAVEKEE